VRSRAGESPRARDRTVFDGDETVARAVGLVVVDDQDARLGVEQVTPLSFRRDGGKDATRRATAGSASIIAPSGPQT